MQLSRLGDAAAFLVILSACGDDGVTASGSGGGATSATTSSTSTGTTTAAGTSTGDPAPQPCVLADAVDMTNDGDVTISSQGIVYTPKCVRVAAGSSVTFLSDFNMHPLRGGAVVDEVGTVDPQSPITPQDSGSTVTFVLDEPGEYPYFCSFHASIGMFGTIWVE
jgi:plastocyanin